MPATLKRILAVGLGLQDDERRVVLLLESESSLVSSRRGLSELEAERFAEGVLEGLRLAGQGYVLHDVDPPGAETGLDWHLRRQPAH